MVVVCSHFHVKPNLGYVRLSCGWVGVLTTRKYDIYFFKTVGQSRNGNPDNVVCIFLISVFIIQNILSIYFETPYSPKYFY